MQPSLEQSQNWLSTVEAHVKNSFPKIIIRSRKIRPSAADCLISRKNKFLKQGKGLEAKMFDAQIAQTISEEGYSKAIMFRKYTDINGSGVLSEMWKLKKRMFSRKASMLPSSKMNYRGKIVTEPKELTKLIGEEYGRVRLRKRPSHPLNLRGKATRKILLKLKLLKAKGTKTEPFAMKDLEIVLSGLKEQKAGGPEGLSRTIFKNTVIGSNLKESLLTLFNKLKDSKFHENGYSNNYSQKRK